MANPDRRLGLVRGRHGLSVDCLSGLRDLRLALAVLSRLLVLDEPIRSLGEHPVTIHLVGRLRPSIVVVVESDGVVEDEESAEVAEGETQATEAGAAVEANANEAGEVEAVAAADEA